MLGVIDGLEVWNGGVQNLINGILSGNRVSHGGLEPVGLDVHSKVCLVPQREIGSAALDCHASSRRGCNASIREFRNCQKVSISARKRLSTVGPSNARTTKTDIIAPIMSVP